MQGKQEPPQLGHREQTCKHLNLFVLEEKQTHQKLKQPHIKLGILCNNKNIKPLYLLKEKCSVEELKDSSI